MRRTRQRTAKTRRHLLAACASLVTMALAARAEAHKASDSYLTLDAASSASASPDWTTSAPTRSFEGRWDIALVDLDDVLGLDADGNGALTQGELDTRENEVRAYALAHLQITAAGHRCEIAPAPLTTVTHSDGTYAVLALKVSCPEAASDAALVLRYSLLFDVDRLHRGLLRVGSSSWVLSPAAPTASLSPSLSVTRGQRLLPGVSLRRRLDELGHFVAAGMGHIASGFDHLLFLLALLLPAVLRRTPSSSTSTATGRSQWRWRAVPSLKDALGDVARIVSAFTLAHSLTLALAATGSVQLPSRVVESAIAASVVLAALDNVVPLFGRERWVVAFALGLLHGFGFSAALGDLGLGGAAFVVALFGFNAGVELGQLALVAVLLPLSFAVRHTRFYRRGALGVGSAAIAVCAALWFVERALALPWPFSIRS